MRTIFLALMLTAVPIVLSIEGLAADLGVNPASEYTAYPASMNRDIYPNESDFARRAPARRVG